MNAFFYDINIYKLYRYIMQTIEIQTLVDITNTKVIRPNQGSQLEHDQYKNFVTLKQCVELRSNITLDMDIVSEVKDVKDLGFGSKYKGKQRVWTFRFNPERQGAYATETDNVGCLYEDLHEVPVIKNLAETINIDKAIFDVKNPTLKNTVVRLIKTVD